MHKDIQVQGSDTTTDCEKTYRSSISYRTPTGEKNRTDDSQAVDLVFAQSDDVQLPFKKLVTKKLLHSKGLQKFSVEVSFPELFIFHQLQMKGNSCLNTFNNILT